jgi:hypothetical protein
MNYNKNGQAVVYVAGGVSLGAGADAESGSPTAGQLSATTSAAALGSSALCSQVVVQADPTNTTDVLVGDSANQYLRLTPGQAAVLPVSDVALLYAKMASSTGRVNWVLIQDVVHAGGTPTAGTLAATTSAVAIGSSATTTLVLVQSDPGNTPDVLVGDSSNQYVRLTPGQSVALPVTNVALVYAKTSSATGTVNWLRIL